MNQAYQIAETFLGFACLIALAVLLIRGKAYKSIAAEWKELATVKALKISDLESRVSNLEAELRTVRGENEELRRLNLEYQRQLTAALDSWKCPFAKG